MSKWDKLLQRMMNDQKAVGYTYAEAAGVLRSLGFSLAARSGGSHRKWALRQGDTTVVIALVESGKGTLKPYLVRDLVRQLRDNGLLP